MGMSRDLATIAGKLIGAMLIVGLLAALVA